MNRKPQTSANIQVPHRSQRGLSLIELMVAITLGLLVLAATAKIFVDTSRSNQEMAKTNSQIENARFAMQLLQNDIVHAGYWGGYIPEFDDLSNLPGDPLPDDVPAAMLPANTVPDPCLAYASWDVADGTVDNNNRAYTNKLIGIPVQSYNGVPAACSSSSVITNRKAGTDVLVVRHAETCLPGVGNCEADDADELYFQPSFCETEISAGNRYVLGDATDTAGFPLQKRGCTAGADKRKLVSNIYWIRNDNTLMRSEFTEKAYDTQPLIEGIEDFRVELGIDDVSETNEAVDYTAETNWVDAKNWTTPRNRGDGSPDGDFVRCPSASCTVAELTNVVAVKLYVLARANSSTPGYTDSKTYTLGPGSAAIGPFNDGFKRHVFTTSVRLHNVSGRRETP